MVEGIDWDDVDPSAYPEPRPRRRRLLSRLHRKADPMKGIYLIERTDAVGYDEYNAVVVIAPDEATALAIAEKHDPPRTFHTSLRADNTRIREIIASQEDDGVLLGSFNAG